ncbi:MAG: hypothetical protein AB7F19_01865 [Candidatus Babeliales bacterium]
MKKLLLTGLLLGVAGANANLDIMNKTDQPLYFELGTEANPPTGKNLKDLKAASKEDASLVGRLKSAGKYFGSKTIGLEQEGSFYETNVDTNNKVLILLSTTKNLIPGHPVTLVTVNPEGRNVFLRIKRDPSGIALFAGSPNKYLVGPQTGPVGGWTGYTERGKPLANIIRQDDITVNPNYDVNAPAQQQQLKGTLQELGIGADIE